MTLLGRLNEDFGTIEHLYENGVAASDILLERARNAHDDFLQKHITSEPVDSLVHRFTEDADTFQAWAADALTDHENDVYEAMRKAFAKGRGGDTAEFGAVMFRLVNEWMEKASEGCE